MKNENLAGWEKSFLPQYITEGNVRYELSFLESNSDEVAYNKLPIDFNVYCFAFARDLNNISIFTNYNLSKGFFFVPYIDVDSKESLSRCISRLVAKLGDEVSTIEKTNNPTVKIIVTRYINKEGKRKFAIGGTNFKQKSKLVSSLNIQTRLWEPIKVCEDESWFSVIADIEDPDTIKSINVKKESILDFEKHKVTVKNKKQHVICLLPDSLFFAQHINGESSITFENKKRYQNFKNKTYNLSTVIFSSENEMYVVIKKLVESFRDLTGCCFVDVNILLKENSEGKSETSIAILQADNPYLCSEDEEES